MPTAKTPAQKQPKKVVADQPPAAVVIEEPRLPPYDPGNPVVVRVVGLPVLLDLDLTRFRGGRSRLIIPSGALRIASRVGADPMEGEAIGAVAATPDGGVQIQIGKVLWWVSFLDLFRYVEAAVTRSSDAAPGDFIQARMDEHTALLAENARLTDALQVQVRKTKLARSGAQDEAKAKVNHAAKKVAKQVAKKQRRK